MLRKAICVTVTLMFAVVLIGGFSGCSSGDNKKSDSDQSSKTDQTDQSNQGTSIANPWVEYPNAEKVQEATGLLINVPTRATDVRFSVNEPEGIAQADFTLEGCRVTDRMKATDELEDISGMYYTWENTSTDTDKHGDSITMSWNDGEAAMLLVYDEQQKITYSASITGTQVSEKVVKSIYEQLVEADAGD